MAAMRLATFRLIGLQFVVRGLFHLFTDVGVLVSQVGSDIGPKK